MNENLARVLNAYIAYLQYIFSVEKLIIYVVGMFVVFIILRGQPVIKHLIRFLFATILSSSVLFLVSSVSKTVLTAERAGWIVIGFAFVWTLYRGVRGLRMKKEK